MNISKALIFSTSFIFMACKGESTNKSPQNDKQNSVYQIQWQSCQKNISAPQDKPYMANFECGRMIVPLNWEEPEGKKIELALMRATAKNPKERIGYLIPNPGGPGGPSINMVNDFPELNYKFDIVGMDPRGIGKSTPIKCPEDVSFLGDIFPKNETEFLALKANSKKLYESCLNLSGDMLHYVDTRSVVQDLEAVRIALGGKTLNFFGYSYGTSIAATYAERYPQNSRALILDGVVDRPSLSTSIHRETKAIKFVFSKFLKWCESETKCALNEEKISSIFHNLKKKYKYRDNKNQEQLITKDEILYVFFYFLTRGAMWEAHVELLNELKNENPDFVKLVLIQTYNLYKKFGTIGTSVTCLDYPVDKISWDDYSKLKDESKKILELLNGNINTLLSVGLCTGWNSPRTAAIPTEHKIAIKQPALFVSSIYDAITANDSAINKAEQIPGSKIVFWEGSAHGSYPMSKCVQNIVNNFLVTTKLPENNITCGENE